MKLKPSNLTPVWITLSIIFLVSALSWFRVDLFERLECVTFDLRVRQCWKQGPSVSPKLGFVYIDESTLEAVNSGQLGYRFGLYWPRQVYGRLLDELAQEGATASALDVIFGELRPDHAPVQMSDGTLQESDEYFARRLRSNPGAILAMSGEVTPPELFLTNAPWIGDITTEKDSDGILRRARAFRTYRTWHPFFRKLASDPAFGVDLQRFTLTNGTLVLHRSRVEDIVIPLDGAGTFALADLSGKGGSGRALPFIEKRVWHMGIVAAALGAGLNLERADVDLERGQIVIPAKDGMARVVPVDSQGRFYIDWAIKAGDPSLLREPMHQLLLKNKLRLQGTNVISSWQGKLAFIGSSAVMGNDLTDRGATPLESDTLLVTKHWNVANAFLNNRFVHRAPFGMEVLLIALMGFLAAIITLKMRAMVALLATTLVIALYIAIAFKVYTESRYWIPIILPVLGASLITHLCLVTWRVVFEQADKRRVSAILATIVSPKIARELLVAEKLSLGGARREVTVLFADVRGFTELTDASQEEAEQQVKARNLAFQEAEDHVNEQARLTLATVNQYLGIVADTVVTHDGTLDKFIGDCVMAFWGAPTPTPRHACNCVRAAIEAQRAVARLNAQRAATNRTLEVENRARAAAGLLLKPLLPILGLGMGINTGMATVGLMGSEVQTVVRQGNYTVFGREINVASRLESLSERAQIHIGESTYQQLLRDDPDLAKLCRPKQPVAVKGIRNPVQIYQVEW